MPRQRLCKYCRGWHDLDRPWPDNCCDPDWSVPQLLEAPRVNGDTMPYHVTSMTNGRHYDSKSALRAEYRRAGVIEVGNDVTTKRPQPSYMEKEAAKRARQASIGRALSKAGFGAP